MNLPLLFLKPTGTQHAHIVFPIQLLKSFHPSIYPQSFPFICSYVREPPEPEREIWQEREIEREKSLLLLFGVFLCGCYPCLVSIVNRLFMEQKKNGGVHMFLFPFIKWQQEQHLLV